MLVERASYSWAYSEDIPGSRCGPEDGPWPRSYQVLDEAELWRELRILAKPQSVLLDQRRGWKADTINFQPSPTTKTQDRYVVTQLDVHGRKWTLTGVFDGELRWFWLNLFHLSTPVLVPSLQVTWAMSRSSTSPITFLSSFETSCEMHSQRTLCANSHLH